MSVLEKQGELRSLDRGDPMFYRFFPAPKSEDGYKGVEVDNFHTCREYHLSILQPYPCYTASDG